MKTGVELDLPRRTSRLLQVAGGLVPPSERAEWRRSWRAELWHVHHHRRHCHGRMPADLLMGVVADALWMRSECWRRRLEGTATLCLAALLGSTLLALLLGAAISGGWSGWAAYVGGHLGCSLVGSVLVIFVAFATSSPKPREHGSTIGTGARMRRHLFFAVKISLLLLLAYLLSVDLSITLYRELPGTADLFQVLDCVVLALVGMRWGLKDQELRCKQCLRLLTTPARVGRPSRNLLEWNGLELSCRWGHGLLSVPEMETSWCGESRWIERKTGWTETARG